jgi:hypothetical protein
LIWLALADIIEDKTASGAATDSQRQQDNSGTGQAIDVH